MFDELINEAAARLNLPIGRVTNLLRSLMGLMTNEETGGPQGFAELFRTAGIGDVLTSWFGGKQGTPVTPTHIEAALGKERLDSLAQSSGLTRTTAASAVAFVLPKLIGMLTPNGVLPSASSLMARLSGLPGTTHPRVSSQVAAPRPGFIKWLPWAAVAVLALLWLSMRSPAGTLPPQLNVSNQQGRVTYSGRVRDASTRDAIVNGLNARFGEANVTGNLRVDSNVQQANWSGRVGDLATAVATPGTEITIDGNSARVGGWISLADRRAVGDRLKASLGPNSVIGALGDAAGEATRAANDQAMSALRALGTSGVAPDALVQAMNLSIVNFPSGSADIPGDSMNVIRTSAQAIKGAPEGTRIEISGHTDNVGDAASNLALSQARADSVRRALIAAGAPAAVLTTRGYGDTRPRSSNGTEQGRFQNRRIEYAVAQ